METPPSPEVTALTARIAALEATVATERKASERRDADAARQVDDLGQLVTRREKQIRDERLEAAAATASAALQFRAEISLITIQREDAIASNRELTAKINGLRVDVANAEAQTACVIAIADKNKREAQAEIAGLTHALEGARGNTFLVGLAGLAAFGSALLGSDDR